MPEVNCYLTYPNGNAIFATVFSDGTIRLADGGRGKLVGNEYRFLDGTPIVAP